MRFTNAYTASEAHAIAGVTVKQINDWSRWGAVQADLRPPNGSGSLRLFSRSGVLKLFVVGELRKLGLPMTARIMPIVQRMDEDGEFSQDPPNRVYLIRPGVIRCYDCHQVIDVLRAWINDYKGPFTCLDMMTLRDRFARRLTEHDDTPLKGTP